jgi:hypothetical protein
LISLYRGIWINITMYRLPFIIALATSVVSVSGYDISFNRSLIPQINVQAWPVFKLGGPVQLPGAFLNQTLSTVAPGVQFVSTGCGGSPTGTGNGVIAQDGNRTVAIIGTAGDVSFYPSYEKLAPAANISTEGISGLINNINIIPRDDTNVSTQPGLSLYGVTHTHTTGGTNSSNPAVYLTHVAAQRSVTVPGHGGVTIRGPGSKAIFGFGADGNVHALQYFWHPAQLGNQTIAPRTLDQIYTAIIVHLQPAAQIAPVTVDSVEITYYDSGALYIQPVVHFTATILGTQKPINSSDTTHARTEGFVSLGLTAAEPLPDLTQPGDLTPPATPQNSTLVPPPPRRRRDIGASLEPRFVAPAINIKVGRYVVRNDSPAWVASANAFYSTLVQYALSPIKFINSQYFWAYPFEFTTQKESYVDSVNIADTEVHGNWHLFSTYQNWGDIVSLSDIPASGYGGGAGGSLAYWMLHSCEVIPSEEDYPSNPVSSFDAWWSVFNGLHAVVGYRTEMWIADGVTTPFAKQIAQGVAVVAAWLNAAHGDSAYAPSCPGNCYTDGNRGFTEPMGRASTISVCGHTDDVVWDVENLGRPGCLFEQWYANGPGYTQ